MAITKLGSGSSFKTLTKYDSFLAGNTAFSPSSYESIATVTAAGGETTLTLSSIPGTYKHLQIRAIVKDTFTASAGGWNNLTVRFNSDSTSFYPSHILSGNGSTASAGGATTTTYLAYVIAEYFGNVSSVYAVNVMDVIDYADTTKYKTVRSFGGFDTNGATAGKIILGSGYWPSTSAVTSISFSGPLISFAAGTSFALYGIKG